MNKRKLLPRAVLVAILLALPAAADAPPTQYDRFDADSLTIKDTFTKIEWDRKGVFKSDFNGAAGNCALLTSLQSSGRLPSVKELLTLVDEEPHLEYEFNDNVPKMIDRGAFGGTPIDSPYWTSTPANAAGDMVWTVSFKTGLMSPIAKTSMANARCMR
ncbi:MAG: hypothetical protein JWO86_1807 [Myxococcaceae bacterium]|nr:hypothetical protein [Myxococcaceae bacterium]MEA2748518.1 hypothetical protein [Myxococcales bacterium]